jgi:hypothetical protein
VALPKGRAKLRARRKRIHENALKRREAAQNDPARVTAPLTPRTLNRELESSTRLRFGPEEAALDSQFRSNAERQRLIPGWFQNYLDSIKQAEASRIQQHAQAQAEITARSGQPDQFASGSQAGQQAQAARGASTANFQNLMTTQNLARGTYYSQLGVAGQGAQVQALQQNAGLARGLERERQDLGRQKGDYKVQLKGQLRDKERQYGLERAAFGLKEADVALDAADKRADNRRQNRAAQDARRAKRDADRWKRAEFIAKYGVTPQEARTLSPQELARRIKSHKPGKAGGSSGDSDGSGGSSVTPTQRRDAKRTFRTALDLAQGAARAGGSSGDIARFLQSKKIRDPLVRQAAAETAVNGGVSPSLRKRFYKEYGIYLRVARKRVVRNAPFRNGEQRPT